MTTPAGVPNLPIGALTVGTLGQRLQDFTQAAVKDRAVERVPGIFASSTGGDIASDFTPFGIITNIWSAINSLIAGSDPADIQGPEDIPPLLTDFIEGLPVVGAFVELFEILVDVANGDYTGDQQIILALQDLIAPLFKFLKYIFGQFIDAFSATDTSFLKPLIEWAESFWQLFGGIVESVLDPVLELIAWAWQKLDAIVGGTADQIIRLIVDGIEWVWINIGESVVRALGVLVDFIAGLIDLTTLKNLIEQIVDALSGTFSAQGFADFLTNIFGGLADVLTADGVIQQITDWVLQIPFLGPLVSKITGLDSSGNTALDLANLGRWAQGLLTSTSRIPAENLYGEFPKALLATLPVSNISLNTPNLLAQGNFNNLETVDPAGGWSWDGTTTATGSGGSAKVIATGSLQQLYSRQVIRVVDGDRLTVSASVKTAGFTSGSMVLSVIPWIGTQAQTAHVIHTRTTSAATFPDGAMSGSTIRIGGTAGPGEVALSGSITAVTVRLAVTANAGAQIWFDNVLAYKTGTLQQVLVESLVAAWNEIWRGLTNPLLPTVTGKTWEDLFGASSGFRSLFNTEKDRGDTLRTNLFGNPATVGTSLLVAALPSLLGAVFDGTVSVQSFLNLLWDAFNGSVSPGATGKNATNVFGAGSDFRSRFNTEKDRGDTLRTNLFGNPTTVGTTVQQAALPLSTILPTVGSGVTMTRSNAHDNSNIYQTQFDGDGVIIPSGFYNTVPTSTADLNTTAIGGKHAVRVSAAGWYQVEVGYQINARDGAFGYHWSLTPSIAVNSTSTITKWGSSGVCTFKSAPFPIDYSAPDFVQSGFIVYLNANDYICPAYVCRKQDGVAITEDRIIRAVGGANGTYFSVALLNRSYA